MLEKSHLFSNSDLYCDAEDLSVFMTFQPSRKKKKNRERECEGSLAFNYLCPSGDLHERLTFWVKMLAPLQSQ